MRLLHFDAQDRLILTDFRGKLIPPYAILSHRWSDSGALIKDISNRKYEEKEQGYRKLRFCAQQAAKDGLQYFWIDTCCIDRTRIAPSSVARRRFARYSPRLGHLPATSLDLIHIVSCVTTRQAEYKMTLVLVGI